MKKIVMVLICLVIIAIFAAFNYLLWERDINIRNYEKLSESKTASIDALGEKIKVLNDVNGQQKSKLDELENKIKELEDRNTAYIQENEILSKKIIQRDNTIFQLKQKANLETIEGNIRKWVYYLNNRNYKQAYDLQLHSLPGKEDIITLNEFTSDYKGIVNNIRIKSIKLYNNESDAETKGDIIFNVLLYVFKTGNSDNGLSDSSLSDKSLFENGENQRFFIMEYSTEAKNWLISYISRVP